MNPFPSLIELDRLIQQPHAQSLPQDALRILEPELKRLTHCSQSIHDIYHAASLKLGPIRSAGRVANAAEPVRDRASGARAGILSARILCPALATGL